MYKSVWSHTIPKCSEYVMIKEKWDKHVEFKVHREVVHQCTFVTSSLLLTLRGGNIWSTFKMVGMSSGLQCQADNICFISSFTLLMFRSHYM